MEEQTMWLILVRVVKNPVFQRVAVAVLTVVIAELTGNAKTRKRS